MDEIAEALIEYLTPEGAFSLEDRADDLIDALDTHVRERLIEAVERRLEAERLSAEVSKQLDAASIEALIRIRG